MLREQERSQIARLWARKLGQEERNAPHEQRHRNLEPVSAEFLHALAVGVRAQRVLEVGGSSGLSTIALAAAMRETSGQLITIEVEPQRQAESRRTVEELNLRSSVEYTLGDAAVVIPSLTGDFDLAFIDCEKEDYIRFFDLISIRAGGVVVADNILSHELWEYVAHVRSRANVESVTLPVGKGLEVTRFR